MRPEVLATREGVDLLAPALPRSLDSQDHFFGDKQVARKR